MAARRTGSRKAGKHDSEREARTGTRGVEREARAGTRGTERGAPVKGGLVRGGAKKGVGGGGNGHRRRKAGGNGRVKAERQIEDTFGFVPSFYGAMSDVAIEHAWGLQRDLELGETSLDPITKELIGLAIASHIKCRYCIYYHTELALRHGATQEQLEEAIAMGGLTVLWSNALTGAQVDIDRFRQEVDRALEQVGEVEQPRVGMQHASF